MTRIAVVLALALGCSITSPPEPAAGTGDLGLPCPGLQCPCPCAAASFCGPHGACTTTCSGPEDCGGAPGETCLGGLCGVACDPGGLDDCSAIGMLGADCLTIQGTAVCGYPTAAVEAADSTGSHIEWRWPNDPSTRIR